MSEKEKLIKRLELCSTMTFWTSIIAGTIVLLMGMSACNTINDYDIRGVSSVLTSVIAFFILIVIILTTCGITVSFIAKAAAYRLRESANMEIKKDTNIIKDMKSVFASSKQSSTSAPTDDHNPLNI